MGVIKRVTEPTSWVSKLHVCIGPKDLNATIQRSHYPLPNIEEILPDLGKAKVFSTVDVKMDIGTLHWTTKAPISQPSTHLLAVIAGFECRLEYPTHLRSFKEVKIRQ